MIELFSKYEACVPVKRPPLLCLLLGQLFSVGIARVVTGRVFLVVLVVVIILAADWISITEMTVQSFILASYLTSCRDIIICLVYHSTSALYCTSRVTGRTRHGRINKWSRKGL